MRSILLLSWVICLAAPLARADDAADKAADKVAARGGIVVRDQNAPGRPVVEVNFTGVAAAEAGFVELVRSVFGNVPLKGMGQTTDADLEALPDLPHLQKLNVGYTKVTDEGLITLVQL